MTGEKMVRFNKKEYDKQYNKQYRKNHKEEIKQYRESHKEERKEYQKAHKEHLNECTKQWRKNNPEKYRATKIKCLYGLSHEDWQKIWENQDGRCVICGKRFTKPSMAFVDHNHKTGKIRGLLCVKCNSGIGYFNDDPKITLKMTEYLLGDK